MSIDIPRPDLAIGKRRRAAATAAGVVLAAILLTLVVLRVRPAAPSASAESLWIETVREGPLVRLVRARGTLVPQQLRLIAAPSDGRVDTILVKPGTVVQPDTILLDLSNDDLQHAAADAQSQRTLAEAELADLRARLDMQLMSLRADAASAESEGHQAALDADVQEKLERDGLASGIVVKKAKTRAEEMNARAAFVRERVVAAQRSIETELSAQRTRLEQARAVEVLRLAQRGALQVRAGISGVLEELFVEPGQRVAPGATLARVADPARLQAELKVPEAQAREIRVGQPARVEIGSSTLPGRVTRVAPAVQNGTVTVDVSFDGGNGLRADESVTGVCEIERLAHAVYIPRPALAEDNGKVRLFRIAGDGKEAVRVTVRLGTGSPESIQVLDGLRAGERVILSDTSRFDTADRIRLD